jgi:hypothetical protein
VAGPPARHRGHYFWTPRLRAPPDLHRAQGCQNLLEFRCTMPTGRAQPESSGTVGRCFGVPSMGRRYRLHAAGTGQYSHDIMYGLRGTQ